MNGTRFTDKYLESRAQSSRSTYGSSYSYPFTPVTPPRSPTKTPAASPKLASTGSPPRKVVTDFAAFGAPANASVFGTAVASTPFSLAGGKAAFGGIRSGGARGMFDADDDEEEDDNRRQKVELRDDSISLDQVRFYAPLPSVAHCSDTALPYPRHDGSPCKAPGGAPVLEASVLKCLPSYLGLSVLAFVVFVPNRQPIPVMYFLFCIFACFCYDAL